MKKPKPGDSKSSSGNQEKLGVPTAMQPWSCEERRSGFRIKKKKRKKETQNSAAQRLVGCLLAGDSHSLPWGLRCVCVATGRPDMLGLFGFSGFLLAAALRFHSSVWAQS